MTDAVLRTLLAILRSNGVSGLVGGEDYIDVFRGDSRGDQVKIGIIVISGDMIRAESGKKVGVLPLCSPGIPGMLDRIFRKVTPKWDPNT